MFKPIFNVFAAAVAVAGFTITGCTTSTMTGDGGFTAGGGRGALNGGRYVELAPKVVTTLTLADLEVSEERVTGTAKGPANARYELEREAVAQALTQKNGSDVLVGASFYHNTSEKTVSGGDGDGASTKRHMTVTVTGYPARYKNFRTYDPKTDGALRRHHDGKPKHRYDGKPKRRHDGEPKRRHAQAPDSSRTVPVPVPVHTPSTGVPKE